MVFNIYGHGGHFDKQTATIRGNTNIQQKCEKSAVDMLLVNKICVSNQTSIVLKLEMCPQMPPPMQSSLLMSKY